jgi:hypothetical protein
VVILPPYVFKRQPQPVEYVKKNTKSIPRGSGTGLRKGGEVMLGETGTGQDTTRGRAGFIRSIFDLSFTSFVTLRVVTILYVLSLILVALYSLFLAFSVASGAYAMTGIEATGGSPALGAILAVLSFLIVLPLVLALGVVYVRVVLELVVVLFRIAENTSELVRQGNPAASTERRGYFPETERSGAAPASEEGAEQKRGEEPG